MAVVALLSLALVAPVGTAASRTARIHPSAPYGRAFRGTGFGAGERVTVDISSGGHRTRVVARAGRDGRFAVRVASGPGRCGDVFVRAVGARGSHAALELARPACREP
jgi:hypothetical protein